jgi:hypothetical protein
MVWSYGRLVGNNVVDRGAILAAGARDFARVPFGAHAHVRHVVSVLLGSFGVHVRNVVYLLFGAHAHIRRVVSILFCCGV